MEQKITLGTKVRTAALFIAILNQILVAFDVHPIPFNQEKVELVVSLVLTGVTSIWAWWKNNSFTKEAKKADVVLEQLRTNK